MKRSIFVWCAALVLTAGTVADADRAYDEFQKALKSGAECRGLFALRNAMDPKSDDKRRATEDLRAIGCYSVDSKRKG